MIYLDNAATTMVPKDIAEEMMRISTSAYGNPGSLHSFGLEAKKMVESARRSISTLIGANPEQIVFISGASEGNSMVFRTVKDEFHEAGGDDFYSIVSSIEHDSVLKVANSVGSVAKISPDASNTITTDMIKTADKDSYRLVSVMAANNEVGIINDVKALCEAAHEIGALFHADCVQALGSIPINVHDIGCDFATFSAHKINGPKGIGVLYVKEPERWKPMIFGGSNQEFGLRGGTENVPAIVGFGMACEAIKSVEEKMSRLNNMKKKLFVSTLRMALTDAGMDDVFVVNGPADCLSNGSKVVSLLVPGVDAETLVLAASAKKVFVSAGAACSGLEQEPSHVLKAIGLTDDEARQSFRVSFSLRTPIQDVYDGACAIADCIVALKGR